VRVPATGRPAEAGHFLLERRARLVRPRIPADASVGLDFGCGNGAQTVLFRDRFDTLYGADIDESHLARFAAAANAPGRASGRAVMTPLLCRDGVVPLPDGAVDCLLSFEVLEHVRDETLVLREWLRVLRAGGRLIVTVPNRWWIFETHGADLPLLPWNRVPFYSWLPRRLHDRHARARIYRRRDVVRLLERAGFRVESATRITAPMDVVRWRPLRDALRRTIFRHDATRVPWLATSILVVARRP
jgi:SAM-dependent methyltransferase